MANQTKTPNWAKLLEDQTYYNICLITHLQGMASRRPPHEIKDILENCSKCRHHKADRQSATVNCVVPFCYDGPNDVCCKFENRMPYDTSCTN